MDPRLCHKTALWPAVSCRLSAYGTGHLIAVRGGNILETITAHRGTVPPHIHHFLPGRVYP